MTDTEILQRMNELDIIHNNLLQTLQKAIQDLELLSSTEQSNNEDTISSRSEDVSWQSLAFPFHEKLRQDQLAPFQSTCMQALEKSKKLPTFEEGQQVMKFLLNSMQIHFAGDERNHYLSNVVDATDLCGSNTMILMHTLHESHSIRDSQQPAVDFVVLVQEEVTHNTIEDNLSLYKTKINSKNHSCIGNVVVRNQRLSEACLSEMHLRKDASNDNVKVQLFMLDATHDAPESISAQVDQVFKGFVLDLGDRRASYSTSHKVCLLAKVKSEYCEKLLTISDSNKDLSKKSRRVYSLVMADCKYILVFPSPREVKDDLMMKPSQGGINHNRQKYHHRDENISRYSNNHHSYYHQHQPSDSRRPSYQDEYENTRKRNYEFNQKDFRSNHHYGSSQQRKNRNDRDEKKRKY
ncbi:hypothetical protein C9374_007121 [Naegleria lovaniensis]|uniref:Uncharacterized protein n=1 Tax=Naegleria lovaniensis TaxID=51637 RepID=A0AA88GZ38_NAELO|nr:uncharacterized protein C9374_007121 [Naegleria lovaniensis]KAG2393590.1 hypothetical protein C9374_007121 [Naegleria lovaniensis]